MPIYSITGIDPGLVDTGIVDLHFDTNNKRLYRRRQVLNPWSDSAYTLHRTTGPLMASDHDRRFTFIEGYRPRAHLSTDKRMVELVRDIQKVTRGKVLANTGIKTVVKKPLLVELACWQFNMSTHHDDLRSAARILVLGMLKNPELNRVLSDYIADNINGHPWDTST
jgi:hypothetical protein